MRTGLGVCAFVAFGMLAACGSKEKSSSGHEDDGARRVAIRVNGAHFRPSKVDARPGERLKLVFTREGPS